MKNKAFIAALLGSFLIFNTSVMANAPQTQPGQMLKVLHDLQSMGFVIVKTIGFDTTNGAYVAKVVNAEGKNIEIQINPKSGEMTKPINEIEGFTALEIASRVQDAGYANIYEINTDFFSNKYEVKVLDNNGHKIKLNLDGKTGKITKANDFL